MLKLIGKGAFTKAYLTNDNEVLLSTSDPIKECMAHGWFPESRLFPTVKIADGQYLEQNKNTFSDNVYLMKYYGKTSGVVKELNKHDRALYKLLRKLTIPCVRNEHDRYQYWHNAFNTLPNEFEEEKQALLEAIDACCNFGTDIAFEISPRNVRVENGQLILLDCFFLTSVLKKVKSKRTNKNPQNWIL